jgi:hypothetical protein
MTEVNWKTPKGTIVDGYDATPPSVNTKCIVFTLLVSVLYWFVDRKELLVPVCITINYLYDQYYDCEKSIPRNILLGSVFALLLMIAPQKNKWVLALCLYLPYIILAIYDYHFDCTRNKFGPTFLANFYAWAKPLHSDQIEVYKNWHPKWKSLINKVDLIVLLILLMVTPFFLRWKVKKMH